MGGENNALIDSYSAMEKNTLRGLCMQREDISLSTGKKAILR